ncbi:MAG: hypothetical protein FJ144_01435 [Deltaproteobacteria bacterium]|nr:hypothetical protein [Deltaproteobacteria bacterium]
MRARLLILATLLATLFASMAFADEQKPNLVLILADDMGYSDVGVLGGEIPTPSIDALASSGVLFTNAARGSSGSADPDP